MRLAAVLAALALLPAAAASAQERRLVGILWSESGPHRLVHVDAGSLRLVPGRSVSIANAWSWSYSPNRSRLVLAESRPGNRGCGRASLRFVDPAVPRTVARRHAGDGEVSALLWAGSRLLMLHEHCGSPTHFVVRDAATARVLRSEPIEGAVIRAVATDEELVLLVAPLDRIGVARLVVLRPNGPNRTVSLTQIAAGAEWTPRDVRRSVNPAFAVAGRRAFVVPPADAVAEIDLDSLDVEYHTLARRALAAPAKASEGSTRFALFVDGVLAVTGRDEETFEARGALQMRDLPAGLDLIDTRTWTARRVDEAATWVSYGGGLLFATRYTWDSSERKVTGMGVAAYDLEGRRRFHAFPRAHAHTVLVHRGRGYVVREDWRRRSTHVVRLADGRVVGRRTGRLPHLLLGRASSYWKNGI